MPQFQSNPLGRLPDTTVVARRIADKYGDMTGAVRRFADVVKAEPLKVARMSIHEAVVGADVSVATANRFARLIGFSGYAEFRAELIRGFEKLFEPVDAMKRHRAEAGSAFEVLEASLREDIANIEATLRSLDPEATERAVDMIARAEKVFVLGFENAAQLSGMLACGLEMTGIPTRSPENGGGMVGVARQLFKYGPKDLLIPIAFSLYMRDTIVMTRYARRAGIPVLAITDFLDSPLVPLADQTLFVTAYHSMHPPSDTAILSLIEALIAAVARQRPGAPEVAEKFASFAYPWMRSTGPDWSPEE